jgi:GT2 family glycosyltransferase
MQPIDLHLVSWKRPKMTELVIRTIHRNTNRNHFRLVVWDNGSGLETQLMLANLQDNGLIDELINYSENVGLEKARHKLLMEHTQSEYFVCIDNDCLPQPADINGDWLQKLVLLMENYEDFAAISCRTQVMIGTGNIFEEADQVGDEIVEFPHPGGSLRIMRTAAVKSVGGWDRGAEGRGAEERLVCGKLRDAGYRTAFAVRVQCLHLFGTRGDNPTDRWGYDASLRPEDTGHSDIAHPALTNGDDIDEVTKYTGRELANAYCNNKN